MQEVALEPAHPEVLSQTALYRYVLYTLVLSMVLWSRTTQRCKECEHFIFR